MKAANEERISRDESLAYPEKELSMAADQIRSIIEKMRRIDTRPGGELMDLIVYIAIWWMTIGYCVSLANLIIGVRSGYRLNPWWWVPVGFTLISIVWPWALCRILDGKVV